MANSSRVEINSSVTDILRSVHGIVYVIFYGRIRIPRISGNFGACADSVYQALLSAHEREPGFEAKSLQAVYAAEMSVYDAEMFVFLDEMGSDRRNALRRHGIGVGTGGARGAMAPPTI